MTFEQDSVINELKLRVKLLEKQDARSAVNMEEKLLLWLVSETIIESDESSELLYNFLERISVILDLPHASCCQYQDNNVTPIVQYKHGSYEDIDSCKYITESNVVKQLQEKPVIVYRENYSEYKIKIPDDQTGIPEVIGLFPFQSLFIPYGVCVFFEAKKGNSKLGPLQLVIHRLILMAVEKLEKLKLMNELKDLNYSFEQKLREETEKYKIQMEGIMNQSNNTKRPGTGYQEDQITASILKDMTIEVRTPMNGILGFAEILRDSSLPENERSNYIDIVKSCARSLLKIVDDSNSFNTILSENFKVNYEAVNITSFLTHLYDHFKKDELYKQREVVELKLNININGSTKIKTDKARLEQILQNLLGNSIKYTPTGSIEFGCYTQENKESKNEVIFFVKDTGIGISEEYGSKIFEPFFKVEHDVSKLFGGMGLGLTIARKLTQKLGGRIWFESTVNKGSSFYVAFPASILIAEKEHVPASTHESQETANWEDKTILIVEDDEMSYIFLKEVLKSTHVKILYANSGNKAVEMAKSHKDIDLILMDIKLPDISGYEATYNIKKFSNVPVIAQTAFAMADDYKKSIEVGCDDYISKPISRKKLLHSIALQFSKSDNSYLN